MDIPLPTAIVTQEQARDLAVQWQDWQSTQSLSYGEVARWQELFEQLAAAFDLRDEFKENGII